VGWERQGKTVSQRKTNGKGGIHLEEKKKKMGRGRGKGGTVKKKEMGGFLGKKKKRGEGELGKKKKRKDSP